MNWYAATFLGVPFIALMWRLTVGKMKPQGMNDEWVPPPTHDPRRNVGGKRMMGTWVDIDDVPYDEEPF